MRFLAVCSLVLVSINQQVFCYNDHDSDHGHDLDHSIKDIPRSLYDNDNQMFSPDNEKSLHAGLPLPFGKRYNDSLLHLNDDDSSMYILPLPIRYFGENFTSVFFNTNGDITFDRNYSGYEPQLIPSMNIPPMIAAFWTDIDTRNGGLNINEIWTRVSTKTDDLTAVRNIIVNAPDGKKFQPKAVAIGTWHEVEAFRQRQGKRNTFQLIVAFSDIETWAIFAYSKLTFFSTESSQSAELGFNDPDGEMGFLLKVVNSTTDLEFLLNETNCNRKGTYAYRVSQKIEVTGCGPDRNPLFKPTFGPNGGGTVIRLSNLRQCLDDITVRVYCWFHGNGVDEINTGTRVSRYAVECVSPFAFETDVKLSYTVLRANDPPPTSSSSANWIHAEQEEFQYFGHRPDVMIVPEDVPVVCSNEIFLVAWDDVKLRAAALAHLNSLDSKVYNENSLNRTLEVFRYNPTSSKSEILLVKVLPSQNTNIADLSIPKDSNSYGIWFRVGYRQVEMPNRILSAFVSELKVATTCSATEFSSVCYNMISKDECPTGNFALLPPCPPTAALAQLHPNVWKTDYLCTWPFGNCYLNPSAGGCFIADGPKTNGNFAAQQCCYFPPDTITGSGALIPQKSLGGGSADCFAGGFDKSLVQQVKHLTHDVLPWFACCKNLDNTACHYYGEQRPTGTSNGYIAPTPPALTWGDPHMKTFDGLTYDFNGYGEYVAVCGIPGNKNKMEILSACDANLPIIGNKFNTASVHYQFAEMNVGDGGTFPVGVAVQDPLHDSGQSSLSLILHPTRRVAVFDGKSIVNFPDPLSYVEYVTHMFPSGMSVSRTSNLSASELVFNVTTPSGMIVSVTEIGGVLFSSVTMPANINPTFGLLGFTNKDKTDDLTSNDGSVVYLNSLLTKPEQDKLIFDSFGQSWMIRNESASLFRALSGSSQGFDVLYDPNYEPDFVPPTIPSELQSAADAACGALTQLARDACYNDIAYTGQVDVFGKIAQVALRWERNIMNLVNNVPQITTGKEYKKTVIIGSKAKFRITFHDNDSDKITMTLRSNANNMFTMVPSANVNSGELIFVGSSEPGTFEAVLTGSDRFAEVAAVATVTVIALCQTKCTESKGVLLYKNFNGNCKQYCFPRWKVANRQIKWNWSCGPCP